MCGIFGSTDSSKLKDLAGFNVKRGNLAFGGLSLADNQEVIFRYSQPYSEELNIPSGDFILCHSLASTGDAKRIHPFETDRFIMAHNGILLNYKKYNSWKIGPVDSQYLLGGIQNSVDGQIGVIKSIQVINGLMEGQRACWMWDRFDKIAYFWRVMSPLFYNLNPFTFSSTEFENSIMMEEGSIYSYDYRNNLFSKCETFKFYSPYLV
jgi:hypothetical protein